MSPLSDDHQMSAEVASVHIKVLNERLTELVSDTRSIRHMLTGNGTPSAGVISRLESLERAMKALEPLPAIVSQQRASAKRWARVSAGVYGLAAPVLTAVATAGLMYVLGLA